jgi:hypothetical protein
MQTGADMDGWGRPFHWQERVAHVVPAAVAAWGLIDSYVYYVNTRPFSSSEFLKIRKLSLEPVGGMSEAPPRTARWPGPSDTGNVLAGVKVRRPAPRGTATEAYGNRNHAGIGGSVTTLADAT